MLTLTDALFLAEMNQMIVLLQYYSCDFFRQKYNTIWLKKY